VGACSGGAVVFVSTPLPPDVSPITYQHPSGVFDVVLPRNWALYEQVGLPIASASFAPPNSEVPLVKISVVNLGKPIEANELGELMLQYQTQVRPDVAVYTEQDRQPMGDGSWRMTGIRLVEGIAQPVNTFLQRSGALFSVLEVAVPQNPALLSDVQVFINTLRLLDETALPSAPLTALADTGNAQLELLNVLAWTSPSGVFFITGEVANRSAFPYSGVPIVGVLTDVNGQGLSEAQDKVMGHAIPAGGFAPFSLRFGEGQPVGAVNYTLTLGGASWAGDTLSVVSAPSLTWTDELVRGTDGQLYIRGIVTNTGNLPVSEGLVTVTVFDERGQVVGVGFSPINEATLTTSESSEYTVLITEVGGNPARYTVNAQAIGQ